MILFLDHLIITSYNSLLYVGLQITYLWRRFEKTLYLVIYRIVNTVAKSVSDRTPSFITIPLHWLVTSRQLRYRLMFEYTYYTPFLKPTPSNTNSPIVTAKINRLWPQNKKSTNESTSTKPLSLTNINWTRSNSILYWVLTPTYFLENSLYKFTNIFTSFYTQTIFIRSTFNQIFKLFRKTIGEGAFYLKGLFIVFFIDACLTDDEPLWEPIEWSLVQTWIMFIFLFAWIGENLITSAYGSYTGRDKRVWFAWYKTFWLIEAWYALSLGLAALFVITPFYHELTYTTPFIVSWWTWYSRVFFCKFVTIYSLALYLSYFLQINIRFFNWKKLLFCTILINLFLSYLLYIHFFMSFFGYLTNPNWYLKNRLVDYIQLSHEPHRWGWGVTKPVKRDHFLQHRSTSLIWFKNDGPFASAFLFFHVYFFICLFTLYLFWITLMRRAYTTKEFTYTFTTFCVSALKQFFYFFFFLYILVFLSFVLNYWRAPVENHWLFFTNSWFWSLMDLYSSFFWRLFKLI